MANFGRDLGMASKACLVLSVAILLTINGVESHLPSRETVFNVMQFGARANGQADDGVAMIRAWRAACLAKGPARLLIPRGEYMASEIIFGGPCTAPKPITIEIQGNLLANTDTSTYTQGAWIMVEHVDGVNITGGGTINGRGQGSWKHADKTHQGPGLTISMRLEFVTNTNVRNLTFVDSMGFHIKVADSNNITVSNLKITAPGDSPDTDGVHVSNSTNVNVANSYIGSGNDCVSVSNGSKKVVLSGLECSPGHGLSIWSRGTPEQDRTDGFEVIDIDKKTSPVIKKDHPRF